MSNPMGLGCQATQGWDQKHAAIANEIKGLRKEEGGQRRGNMSGSTMWLYAFRVPSGWHELMHCEMDTGKHI